MSTYVGLAANVKLLLKLIEDHNEACTKDYDGRKTQRVASMITILDEVKSRIQKSQSLGKRREAALRRCNTELRANRGSPPHGDRSRFLNDSTMMTTADEKEMLRRELSACMTARKSLERMFSSLGKEKEIMASELARKVHELNGIEEHVNDLKAQNELLLAKVQACAAEHKGRKQSACVGDITTQEDNVALEERNKALSEKLLKSLDGYRSLKRRLKEAQEEKECVQEQMEEMVEQAAIGLNRIVGLRRRIAEGKEQPYEIEEELSVLEDIFRSFDTLKLSENGPNRADDCFNHELTVD
ncbi:hypothetical protein BVC80_753g12 [Macleaya cordata]|uniref:Uncharacterized protein n=1 Tax=Macleaya cordata TaxID=56857 RepID=A0A200QS39_MACCD|nr:hypothetical protein BVC80_753g12 [Macleaya cordata]